MNHQQKSAIPGVQRDDRIRHRGKTEKSEELLCQLEESKLSELSIRAIGRIQSPDTGDLEAQNLRLALTGSC